MFERIEAVVDDEGKISLPEPIKLRPAQRVIVTILRDEPKSKAFPQTDQINGIEVHFLHHRYPKSFTALIDPQCTGEQAIEGLMIGDKEGPFLDSPPPGQSYELILRRTYCTITPDMTFAQADIAQGDTIEVRQAGQGAGHNFNEIAELVLSSGVTLAFLKAVTSIVTQLLNNREKVWEYEENGKKYRLTMHSSINNMIKAVSALRNNADDVKQQALNKKVGTKPRASIKAKPENRKKPLYAKKDEPKVNESVRNSASSSNPAKNYTKAKKKTHKESGDT